MKLIEISQANAKRCILFFSVDGKLNQLNK